MKHLKLIAIIIIPVILLIIIINNISCSGSGAFRVVTVKKGPFYITVHTVGRLKSANSLDIGCPNVLDIWSYTISFMAPEGKPIKKGDNILSFDDKQLREQLMLKQSELETAKKELERIRLVEQEVQDNLELQVAESRANKEKAQRKTIAPDELVALNEVEKNKMDLELATMQVKLYQGRIKMQELRKKNLISTQRNKIKELTRQVAEIQDGIVKMRVKAPKDGLLAYSIDWRGNKKAPGDRCWFGSEIMEIPDLEQMQATTVIPEPQAEKVKVGQEVEIRLDSNPDRVFKGKIESLGQIFREKSYDQPTIVFDAVIDIPEPDPAIMRPGMAAGLDIIISSKENVLQIPEAGLIYHEKGLFVLKKEFFGEKMVPVTLGARSGGNIEILSGLEEGERIIIQHSDRDTGSNNGMLPGGGR